MKEKFINNGINFISKYQDCNDLKIKKIKYGLEGIYSLVLKLSTVIIIAFLIGIIKETLLFILFFAGLRSFGFGLHAKSNLACWLTTILFYNIIPLLIAHIAIPKYISYIVIAISFIIFSLYAPADTEKRPLIRKNVRIKCKITTPITF